MIKVNKISYLSGSEEFHLFARYDNLAGPPGLIARLDSMPALSLKQLSDRILSIGEDETIPKHSAVEIKLELEAAKEFAK